MNEHDDIAAAAAARVKQRQADWEARVEAGRAKIRAGYEQTRFLREEEGHRMRVMLEKAVNMITAFFAELDRVRPDIPDELLNDWLFWQVGRTLNSLDQIAKIFDFADEERIRVSLKKARILAKEQAAAERAHAAAEKAAQRAVEDEARRQREAEKAEKAAEAERRVALAEAQLEPQKIPPEIVEEIKNRILARKPVGWTTVKQEFGVSERMARNAVEQARGEVRAEARLAGVLPEPPKRRRRNDSRDVVAEMASGVTPVPPDMGVERPLDLDALASAIHAALDRITLVRSEWIELTLDLAGKLHQARELLPFNPAFSAWLEANGIDAKLTKDDRSALVGLGRDLAATRTVLEKSTSWSWRNIWKQMFNRGLSSQNCEHTTDEPAAPAQTLH